MCSTRQYRRGRRTEHLGDDKHRLETIWSMFSDTSQWLRLNTYFPFLKQKDCEISAVNNLFVIHISLFRDRLRLENQLIWADRRTVTTVRATNHTKTMAGPRPQLSAFERQTEAVRDRGLYPSCIVIVHRASRCQEPSMYTQKE